jgi:hypothetical protein
VLTTLLVPQGMAYAELAGPPPVNDAGQAPRVTGGSLLAAASCLLLLLAAAQGYVSFRTQHAFVDHA